MIDIKRIVTIWDKLKLGLKIIKLFIYFKRK
jgi:hypothetical protein